MPEGDTIHRAAQRLDAALTGRVMEVADAPSSRSPLHLRARELKGATLEKVEARGKHLLVYFSTGQVVHSHLGMNGRWRITGDGRLPAGKPWLLLAGGGGVAAQSGGKILRLVSATKARNDPGLRTLGPDPLAPDFDVEAAARRLRERGAGRELGEALLDQGILAGVGNAIRNEACYVTGLSPWKRIDALDPERLEAVVGATEDIMRESMQKGRRPRSIYRADRRGGCPRCGGRVSVRGQGDDNRTAYWCPSCQP